tara:strand:+ start:179021 stop:179398 length:378 start_codon:yes stop_codon:yes gene_type:complete
MRPQIHIIDDEASIRESLTALLDVFGWEAHTYATASGYLATLSETDTDRPQCLLVDVQLPEMSGLDLLKELNRRGVSIPFIVMTGHGDNAIEARAAEQNAVGYFQKPFHTSELLKTLSSILSPAT